MVKSEDHNYEPDKKDKKIYRDFVRWFKPLLFERISKIITLEDTSLIPDPILRKAVDLIVDYGYSSDEALGELIEECAFCWFFRLVAWQYLKIKGFTDKDFLQTCHFLHPYIDLFQAPGDYTEEAFDVPDEVYSRLAELPLDNIFHIGWIYQYYNEDNKDAFYLESRTKNKKSDKGKDITAATCLYTPYWVVRYMEENSLGKLWIDHKRGQNPKLNEKDEAEHFGWSYYIETAEQCEGTESELQRIREGWKDLKPNEITFFEPCMGSGLMLLSAFDIFIQLYQDEGIEPKEAAQSILEKNLYGTDIDVKAWRLAKFSLLARAAEYDPDILTRKVSLHLTAPVIDGRDIDQQKIMWFGTEIEGLDRMKALLMIQGLCEDFEIVKKVGALVKPRTGLDIDLMRRYINSPENVPDLEATQFQVNNLIDFCEILLREYYICCTNPPFFSSKHYDSDIKNFFNTGAIVIPPELDPWEDVYWPTIIKEFNSNLFENFKVKNKPKEKKQMSFFDKG